MNKVQFVTATLLLCTLSSAQAGPVREAGGSYNGMNWQASSVIVGVDSTGGFDGGGNPNYFAAMPQYSGVVALIMDYGGGNRFICSGTLLPDRRSILTAAHCVTNDTLEQPITTTAYFYGGSDPNTRVPFNPLATAIDVSQYFVNSQYTGQVIDQNDIAVLRLQSDAPDFAESYDLFTGELTGEDFNVAGYGVRSDTGGTVGGNSRTGFLRQGDNRYDFRLGDSDFGGFWTDDFFGTAEYAYSYWSDFDNGTAANDAACVIANALGLDGPKFCNLGVGFMEVGVAGGDSGGPQFINGMIASVTSYGVTFGSNFGDWDNALNSSFGEFSGYVPVFIHERFIRSAMAVPEPGSLALASFALLALFGARRRRHQ